MTEDGEPQGPNRIGAGVAIGAGVGAAMFAATDNPAWIAIGAGIGAALGAAWGRGRP